MIETKQGKLEGVKTLVRNYRTFRDDWRERRMIEFSHRFDGVRAGLRTLRELSARRDRFEAPDFNLFQVLGIHTREVKTHSALLADLLSPSGRHGQGDLFLRAFLSLVAKTKERPTSAGFATLPSAHWETSVELAFDDGRTDIVLRHPRAGALIVIENKIYAADQDEQLDRYWRWMQARQYVWPTQLLIYLTLDGHAPEVEPAEASYIKMSYRRDIAPLLKETLTQVPSPLVATVIRQYLEL